MTKLPFEIGQPESFSIAISSAAYAALPPELQKKLSAAYDSKKKTLEIVKKHGLTVKERKLVEKEMGDEREVTREAIDLALRIAQDTGKPLAEVASFLDKPNEYPEFIKYVSDVLDIQAKRQEMDFSSVAVTVVLRSRVSPDWVKEDTEELNESLFDSLWYFVQQERMGWEEDQEQELGESQPSENSESEANNSLPPTNRTGRKSTKKSSKQGFQPATSDSTTPTSETAQTG